MQSLDDILAGNGRARAGKLDAGGLLVAWDNGALTVTREESSRELLLPEDAGALQLSRDIDRTEAGGWRFWKSSRETHLLNLSLRYGEDRLHLSAPMRPGEVAPLVRQRVKGEHVTPDELLSLLTYLLAHDVQLAEGSRAGQSGDSTLVDTSDLDFSNGLAPCESGGKWGFVDRDGWWVVPPGYEEVRPFSSKRAAVREGKYWGFVSTAGDEVIQREWQEVEDFDGLSTRVRKQPANDWRYITRSGRLALLPSTWTKVKKHAFTIVVGLLFLIGVVIGITNHEAAQHESKHEEDSPPAIVFQSQIRWALDDFSTDVGTIAGHVETLRLEDRALDAQRARILAGAEHLTSLREVHLRNNQIGRAGLEALLASSLFTEVQELDVSRNRIGRLFEGDSRNLAWQTLALTKLDLSHNQLNDEQAITLLRKLPSPGKLEHLNLGHNPVGSPTMRWIVDHLPGLRELHVDRTRMSGEDLQLLTEEMPIAEFKELGLGGLPAAADFLKALPDMSALRRLALDEAPLEETDFGFLTGMSSLGALSLRGTGIQSFQVTMLVDSGALARLTELDIGNNALEPADVRQLIKALGPMQVLELGNDSDARNQVQVEAPLFSHFDAGELGKTTLLDLRRTGADRAVLQELLDHPRHERFYPQRIVEVDAIDSDVKFDLSAKDWQAREPSRLSLTFFGNRDSPLDGYGWERARWARHVAVHTASGDELDRILDTIQSDARVQPEWLLTRNAELSPEQLQTLLLLPDRVTGLDLDLELTPEMLTVLTESGALEEVEEFGLRGPIRAELLQQLLDAREFNPAELNLPKSHLRPRHVSALLQWSSWSAVMRIDLSENYLGDAALSDLIWALGAPLESVNLTGTNAGPSTLKALATRDLSGLRTLNLADNQLSEEALLRFFERASLPMLRDLNLSGNDVSGDVVAAALTNAPELQLVDLSEPLEPTGPEMTGALLKSDRLNQLDHINLSSSGLQDRDLGPLKVSAAAGGQTQTWVLYDNPIDPQTIAVLRASHYTVHASSPPEPRLPELKRRTLHVSPIEPARMAEALAEMDLAAASAIYTVGPVKAVHAEVLTRESGLRQCESLSINGAVDPEFLETMIMSDTFAGLKYLFLDDTSAGKQTLQVLANAPLTSVYSIDLSHNPLDPEGMKAFGNSPIAAQLRSLTLGGEPPIEAETFQALARAPLTLRSLTIVGGPIGLEGLSELGQGPWQGNLRSLEIDDFRNRGPEALAALYQAPEAWVGLKALEIQNSVVDEKSFQMLAARPGFQQLDKLALSGTLLSAAVLEEIVDTGFTDLGSLDIGRNPLDLPDLEPLFVDGALPSLKSLSLSNQASGPRLSLGDKGLARLAQSSLGRQLKYLHLGHNDLTDASLDTLANWPGPLRTLFLYPDTFTEEQVAALKAAVSYKVRN